MDFEPEDFSGKWCLQPEQTTGDVAGCIGMLGRKSWEIKLLNSATDTQLVQHYMMKGVHAIQRRVHYCVLHVRDFRFGDLLVLDSKKHENEPDHRGFGQCQTVGKWISSRSYQVERFMILEGKKTKMTVTSTLSHETNKSNDSTSGGEKGREKSQKSKARFMKIRLEMEQGEKHLHCTKIYERKSPTEEEREKMRDMSKGREHRLYRVLQKR
jgi:hypothetical protein